MKGNENMPKTEEQPYLVWDTSDIIENQVKYLVEENGVTEEDARAGAYDDPDIIDWEREYLDEQLTELMGRINKAGYWDANVENFGWMKSDGTNQRTPSAGRMAEVQGPSRRNNVR